MNDDFVQEPSGGSMDDSEPDSEPRPDEEEPSTGEEEGVRSDPEIKEILEAADEDVPPRFEFPPVEEAEEERGEEKEELGDTQDPVKAHKLYYGKKEKLLRTYLPEGEEHKEARRLIRDEVNLYLKEGNETGRDGRQAYHFLMEEVVSEIQEWVERGESLFDLYVRIREMNQEAGYRD